jgi:hypothetical protein
MSRGKIRVWSDRAIGYGWREAEHISFDGPRGRWVRLQSEYGPVERYCELRPCAQDSDPNESGMCRWELL